MQSCQQESIQFKRFPDNIIDGSDEIDALSLSTHSFSSSSHYCSIDQSVIKAIMDLFGDNDESRMMSPSSEDDLPSLPDTAFDDAAVGDTAFDDAAVGIAAVGDAAAPAVNYNNVDGGNDVDGNDNDNNEMPSNETIRAALLSLPLFMDGIQDIRKRVTNK